MSKVFHLDVVASSYDRGDGKLLSLRKEGRGTLVKTGLAEAGFKPGDRVVIIPAEDYEAFQEAAFRLKGLDK